MTTIRSLDEIPSFASEDEEREWWATHDLSEELYDKLELSPEESKKLLDSLDTKAKRRATG